MRLRGECDKLDVFCSVNSLLGLNSSSNPYTIPLLKVKSVYGKWAFCVSVTWTHIFHKLLI